MMMFLFRNLENLLEKLVKSEMHAERKGFGVWEKLTWREWAKEKSLLHAYWRRRS